MKVGMLLAMLAGMASSAAPQVSTRGGVRLREPKQQLPRFVDVDDGRPGKWLGPPKWSRRLKLRRRRSRAQR